MGQYRLWLQYREIDQLLSAQLKTLVNDLAQIDEQIRLLANSTVQVDNMIIQALLKEVQVDSSFVPIPAMPVQAIASPAVDLTLVDTVDLQDQGQPSASSAIFSWGRLPNSASLELDMQNPTRETALSPSASWTPLSTENLFSPDIESFVATYSSTPSQTKITRRFPDVISPTDEISSNGSSCPVDQQSIRINQGVERWFKRRTHFPQGSSSNQEKQKESML